MTQLSPKGLRAVEEIAHRTGFSQEAVTSMLFSIVGGRGGMAQFSHPELGGSGQWMAGGAIMISDMFNNALKARVDALCNELSALIRNEPGLRRCRLVSIAKSGRAWEFSTWIVKPSGRCWAGPSELVALGSWRSLEPRSTERSSLRLFFRHPASRHRRQWESERLRHAGSSD
jgi:hypothetical protein